MSSLHFPILKYMCGEFYEYKMNIVSTIILRHYDDYNDCYNYICLS